MINVSTLFIVFSSFIYSHIVIRFMLFDMCLVGISSIVGYLIYFFTYAGVGCEYNFILVRVYGFFLHV